MTRLAVFDCDGTILDSQAVIVRAMRTCFADAGLTPPEDAAVRRIVGLSLPQAMAVLLPRAGGALHHDLAERYKRAFHAMRGAGEIREPLFDGLVDALTALAADGWRLGVATGKSTRGLRLALTGHGLHDRFVTLQTADGHPSKPHPAMLHAAMAEAGARPDTTVMIGDTSYDMLMAKAAGVRAIGVAWGYHPVEELVDAGADAVAARPADLPGLMTESA